MSFLGFHPCPKCGSRDNFAEYTDNFYCFGCGNTEQKRNLSRFKQQTEVRVCDGITLEKSLPMDAKKWLLGYGLTLQEMSQFNYSRQRTVKNEIRRCNLLVLIANGDYWLARNLDMGTRYLSSGVKPYLEYGDKTDTLVFVEDVISAVKVGRVATAVPMLGASVLKDWWKYAKPYKNVIIWGDRDKAGQNIVQAKRAGEILGKKVRVIITEKDPKEYNTKELDNYIKA